MSVVSPGGNAHVCLGVILLSFKNRYFLPAKLKLTRPPNPEPPTSVEMTTPSLRAYMDTRRTKTDDWNITGLGTGPNGWIGKYKIPEDEYDDFLMLAHDHVFVRGKTHSLLEKHKAQSPILIDLDFRYASGGPLRRRFTSEQLRAFVAVYADAFAKFFHAPKDDDGDPQPLQFFVSLKPSPECASDAHKDGVHIVCPTLTTAPEIQFAIRGYLLQTGAIERIFGETGLTNPAQDCLDISVIARNNWFLYGACKPDKAWYKVEHIYSADIPDDYTEELKAEDLDEESRDEWTPADLIKLQSLQYGHDVRTKLVPRTGTDTEAEWAQLLQRWGKGASWVKPTKSPALQPKAGAEMPPLSLDASAPTEEMVQLSGLTVRTPPSSEDVVLAYKLVRECLNPTKRAKSYHDWVTLGLLLRNIASSEESLKVWAEFSRRVPGYATKPDKDFVDKWALLPDEASTIQRGRKPLTMGSLIHWAREDAPTTYNDIMKAINTNLAYLNDSGTHVSIAEMAVRLYKEEFRCTPPRKGAAAAAMDWYQFPPESHTWRSLKTGMRLRERLSNDVRNFYLLADAQATTRQAAPTTDESERERLQEKCKKLRKVQVQLQNSGFKDSVMKEAVEKFYDEEFLQHMNQDPALVGFSNGVLELRNQSTDGQLHILFRPGRPDDRVSFQMGRGMVGLDAIPYIPYDASAPEQLEIADFFTKIYPDPVLREYALTLFSSCLEGANREQKFYIMTGVGSNGKSKIVELMSKTFGEYQETIGTTALTRKRPDSGAANPDLVVLKCKRFVSMSEPDEGEKINTASMKQLSGEDTVKARALFQDQDQFVIMAKIFMLCNDLPPVSSTDGGTWRRLRVIPHVAKFVDHDKPIDPTNHVYHKDLMLDGKISRWRPYFASLLAHYYETRYLRGGLKEPDQVAAASSKYKETNDAFVSFNQECLVREVGAELKTTEIYQRYKEWMKYNVGRKVLQNAAILQKMTELYGKPVDAAGRVFAGVRLAMEEEQDISGGLMSL